MSKDAGVLGATARVSLCAEPWAVPSSSNETTRTAGKGPRWPGQPLMHAHESTGLPWGDRAELVLGDSPLPAQIAGLSPSPPFLSSAQLCRGQDGTTTSSSFCCHRQPQSQRRENNTLPMAFAKGLLKSVGSRASLNDSGGVQLRPKDGAGTAGSNGTPPAPLSPPTETDAPHPPAARMPAWRPNKTVSSAGRREAHRPTSARRAGNTVQSKAQEPGLCPAIYVINTISDWMEVGLQKAADVAPKPTIDDIHAVWGSGPMSDICSAWAGQAKAVGSPQPHPGKILQYWTTRRPV